MAAQAFHWFDAGAALRRPNGAVFLGGPAAGSGGPLQRRAELEALVQEVREAEAARGRAAAALEYTLAELAKADAAFTVAGAEAESARQAEFAVGARKGNIVDLILREVAWVAGVGVLVGMGATLALGRLVEGLVFGIKPGDARIEAAAAMVLAAVAILAAWFPARRAASMDPMAALRYE